MNRTLQDFFRFQIAEHVSQCRTVLNIHLLSRTGFCSLFLSFSLFSVWIGNKLYIMWFLTMAKFFLTQQFLPTAKFFSGQLIYILPKLYLNKIAKKDTKQLCTKDMQMGFWVFRTSVCFSFSTVIVWWSVVLGYEVRIELHLIFVLVWAHTHKNVRSKWVCPLRPGPWGVNDWRRGWWSGVPCLFLKVLIAFTAGQRITMWLLLGCIFSRITCTYSTLLSVAQIVLSLSFSFIFCCVCLATVCSFCQNVIFDQTIIDSHIFIHFTV